tara:strand:- start:118 stop:237 length:120 start_codon:yes stop_codon:yes gene_type:complete
MEDDNSDILRRYWRTVPKSSAAVGWLYAATGGGEEPGFG